MGGEQLKRKRGRKEDTKERERERERERESKNWYSLQSYVKLGGFDKICDKMRANFFLRDAQCQGKTRKRRRSRRRREMSNGSVLTIWYNKYNQLIKLRLSFPVRRIR